MTNYNQTNGFLYNFLHADCTNDSGQIVSCETATKKKGIFEDGFQHIFGINGYWTLSTANDSNVWFVNYDGYVYAGIIYYDAYFGVRPVINIKI